MTITQETVSHVANLARLELSADELARYTQDLSQILALIEQLDALNLDHVDMTVNAADLPPTVYREDIGERQFSHEQLMTNAPEAEEGFFRVPKILADAKPEPKSSNQSATNADKPTGEAAHA